MTDQEKFANLVMFLAENYEAGDIDFDIEVSNFEDAIDNSGFGDAYFGIAKSDWSRIEIIRPVYFPYKYKDDGTKFYAEYYDGSQAPFTVCRWCDNFEKLEELFKNTTNLVYKKYIEFLENNKKEY